MKVYLIRIEIIKRYTQNNAQGRISFNEWCAKLNFANWVVPADMKVTFPSADLLGRGTSRVVFDIGGNKYRVIGKYAFGDKQVHLFICWIGTHSSYDKLCYNGKQYTINDY